MRHLIRTLTWLACAAFVLLQSQVGAALDFDGAIEEAQSVGSIADDQEECSQSVAEACRRLGDAYFYGRGFPAVIARGVDFYRRACELGSDAACITEGLWFYQIGDPGEALKRFLLSCARNDGKSCQRAATLENELGKHKEEAAHWLKACSLGVGDACFSHVLTSEKQQRPLGPTETTKFLTRACSLNSPQACARLGLELYEKDKFGKSVPFLTSACELGLVEGCLLLGSIFIEGKFGKPTDAAHWHYMACFLWNIAGCKEAAKAYGQLDSEIRDDRKLYKSLSYACGAGDEESCVAKAKLTQAGRGCKQSECTQAVTILVGSCNRGFAPACEGAAAAYHDGVGTAASLPYARVLYGAACRYGSKESCSKAQGKP